MYGRVKYSNSTKGNVRIKDRFTKKMETIRWGVQVYPDLRALGFVFSYAPVFFAGLFTICTCSVQLYTVLSLLEITFHCFYFAKKTRGDGEV
jgi:hypothetical protein